MKVVFPYDTRYHYNVQPLGVRIISTVLKNAGHQVEVCESDDAELDAVLSRSDPKETILALSSTTAMAQFYVGLAQRARKKHDVFTVMGGVHVTYYPETVYIDGIDGICMGEGDFALLDVIQAMEAGADYRQIQNWWFKDPDGTIHKNPLRPFIEDLDSIPFADRTIFADKNHVSDVVMTSRGCPYKCTYCFNHSYNQIYGSRKAQLRYRSVDNVIEELKLIKARTPDTYIDFVDDIFIMNREWFEEFAPRYKKEVGLPYVCNIRANYITPEVAKLMKESNCHTAALGVEAGNDHLRNKVLLRNMSKGKIVECCEELRRNDIRFWTYNIVGLPQGDLEADLETLDLNIQIKPDGVAAFIMQPYKGTEIYDIAKAAGMIEDVDEGFDYSEDWAASGNMNVWNNVWHNPQLQYKDAKTKQEIVNLRNLFGFVAEFSFLRPLVPTLVKLPIPTVYRYIHSIWWKYTWATRIIPISFRQVWTRLNLTDKFIAQIRGKGHQKVNPAAVISSAGGQSTEVDAAIAA